MAKARDITGETFGRLTAVRSVDGCDWLFRCDCGTEIVRPRRVITGGNTRSCGCLYRERAFRWGKANLQDLPERFFRYVDKTDGCWNWTGQICHRGYGKFSKDSRKQCAHRVSWELANGPIPPDGLCLHHCDNTLCVNPDHLYIGSYRDNAIDSVHRGRAGRGVQILEPSDVVEIRRSIASVEELAYIFGVRPGTIYGIKRGYSWKHVIAA